MYKKISFALSILLLLLNVTQVCSVNADDEVKSRIINVVYDDSGSMDETDGDSFERWARAQYAMEVFAAMLGEEDELNIYPLSGGGDVSVSIKGSDSPQQRVDKIHGMINRGGRTPYAPVQSAFQNLESVRNKDERWLVILTDGKFTTADGNLYDVNEIQSEIEAFVGNDENSYVAWLAIGQGAYVIDDKNISNIFAHQAENGVDVLPKITEIANQIFNQNILPDDYIEKKESELEVHIDIPMEYLIVFAQGDDVQVGDINGLTKQYEIDIKKPKRTNGIGSLSGKLVYFVGSNNGLVADSDYQIPVSNTDNVQIYYKPSVELKNSVYYNDSLIDISNDNLYSGTYKIQLDLYNPISGQKVESKLLDDMVYTSTVERAGTKTEYIGREFEIDVINELATIECVADMPGAPTLFNTFRISTIPKLGQIDLVLTDADTDYYIETLEIEGGFSFEVLLDAEVIEKDLFEKMDFTIYADKMDFDIVKDADTATINVTPKYNRGVLGATAVGNVDIQAQVNLEDFGQKTSDVEIISIYIEDIPFWDKYGKKIIALLLLLLLIIAYASKAYLPRKLKPYFIITEGRAATKAKRILVKRNILSILIPFVPVTAVLSIRTTQRIPFTSLKVKGYKKSKNGFWIKNKKVFYSDDNILWDGVDVIDESYSDRKWVLGSIGQEIFIKLPNRGVRKKYFEIRFSKQ